MEDIANKNYIDKNLNGGGGGKGNGAAFHLNSSCKQKLKCEEKTALLPRSENWFRNKIRKVFRKANMEDKLLFSFKH